MADIEVLTEHALEVTAGKKNGPGAASADQDGFFAEVRPHRADQRHIGYTAKAYLALAAIDLALAGTKHTRIHPLS